MTTAWRSLPDRPLQGGREFEACDAGRLRPLTDTLVVMMLRWLPTPVSLRDWWPAQPAAPLEAEAEAQAQRVAVLGGLGQGKTSAVREALRRVREHWRYPGHWQTFLFGDPVEVFDVASYKASDLEFRFFTAVLIRRVIHNTALVMAAVVMLVLLAAYLLTVLSPQDRWRVAGVVNDWWPTDAWVAACLALSPLLVLLITHMRVSSVHASLRDRLVHQIGRAFWALPYIVIVDDLDRASVAQQRSFLRTLRRLSLDMGFAVIVCMDETELLKSAHDPESPEQLLRKTLEVELHVPDRSREDVIMLVLAICREAARLNPLRADVLAHAQWLGDLVRVLLLMQAVGRVGPRLVKRLVNDVGQQAGALSVTHLDDWCALLRLESLYRTVPDLRRHSDGMRRVLESNRADEFEELLNQCLSSDDALALRSRAHQVFDRTRAMQPHRVDGWFLHLGGHNDAYRGTQPAPAPTLPHELVQDLKLPLQADLFTWTRVFSEGAELQTRGYDAALNPSAVEPDATDLDPANPAAPSRRLTLRSLAYWLEFELCSREQLAEPSTGVTRLHETWWNGRSLTGPAYAHAWLCWMAVLSKTEEVRRETLFGSLWDWVGHALRASEVATHQQPPLTAEAQMALRRLLMREQAADSEAWRTLVNRSDNELDTRYRRCLFGAPVGKDDLPHLARALARLKPPAPSGRVTPAALRGNDRELLHLLQPVVPCALDAQLRQDEFVVGDLPLVWPAHKPGTEGSIGQRHGLSPALGQLVRDFQYVHKLPGPWMHAWFVTARVHLTTWECLNLLYSAAGWSLDRLRPWLADRHRLPHQLAALAHADVDSWTGIDAPDWLDARVCLTSVFVAKLADWPMPVGVLAYVRDSDLDILDEALRELLQLPETRTDRDAQAERAWWVAAMQRVKGHAASSAPNLTVEALPHMLRRLRPAEGMDILQRADYELGLPEP